MIEAVYAVLLYGEHVGAIHRRDAFTKFIFDMRRIMCPPGSPICFPRGGYGTLLLASKE